MKKLGPGVVALFFLQALVAACGDGGEPGPDTPSGACCTGAQCTRVTSAACASMDGVYKGDNMECGTGTCSSATGACFGSGNVCTMKTREACPPPSEYGGDGSTCPPS